MTLGIVHGYPLLWQFSMDIYANRLTEALETVAPALEIEHLRPDVSLSGFRDPRARRVIGAYDRFVRYPRALRRSSREAPLGCYHIVDHSNAYLVDALPAARTVVTCHDVIPLLIDSGEVGESDVSRGGIRRFKGRLEPIRRARVVLASSETTKRDLIRFEVCDEARIRIVKLGLPFPFEPMRTADRDRIRQRLDLDGKHVLLHVGGSVFYKNIEGVLAALRGLAEEGRSDVLLLKVGAPLTDAQQALVDGWGLGTLVRYAGSVDGPEDLVDFYAAADVLVFPSMYEGFGWPPLEAMACGLPVVCSDRGALRENVGTAALICNPDSPSSIAAHVRAVIDDPDLAAELKRRGFERVRRFSWTTAAKQTLEAYRACD